jgi:hypothetical protein
MNIATEPLAALLAGIARSWQAVIDAIDRANRGFLGTYFAPMLNVAANLRIPEVRLLDLSSRIPLRSQGRVPMDVETVIATLSAALGRPAAIAATAPAVPSAPSLEPAATEDDFFDSRKTWLRQLMPRSNAK